MQEAFQKFPDPHSVKKLQQAFLLTNKQQLQLSFTVKRTSKIKKIGKVGTRKTE